jgi:outer membrane assembly lipoprotein YfgL
VTRPAARAAAGFAALLLAALLAGCGSDRPKPTPLEPLAPKIAGRQVWNHKIGAVHLPLSVAVRDDAFIVAASDGTVAAFEAANGREQWRAQAGASLSAGVGSDGRFTAVVTRDNELVVLERAQLRWKAPLASRTVTAPLVAGERVFVMGVDRVVHAFDAFDGRRLWQLRRPGDSLTLAQPGVLLPFKDTLLAGQGTSLVGVDPLRGGVRWELVMANPRSTNEIERLADLVAPAVRQGSMVCARAFQAAVACADAERGTLAWTRVGGGTQGVGGDADMVVGADASDRISALRAASGEVAWTNGTMLYRGLSAPLLVGRAVVLGDQEGQVHFLDRADGKPLLRLPTDGSAVVAAPVAVGTTVLVVTRNGGLYAFRPD